MASVFKPGGKSKYVIFYTDENGRRRKKTGATDKAVSERIARDIENRVALRREGLIDPAAERFLVHAGQSLLVHIDTWTESLRSRGNTRQHIKLHSSRALRLLALIKGANLADIEPSKPATREGVARATAALRKSAASARLSDLTTETVQKALARLIAEGRSLQTANHHRNAIKS